MTNEIPAALLQCSLLKEEVVISSSIRGELFSNSLMKSHHSLSQSWPQNGQSIVITYTRLGIWWNKVKSWAQMPPYPWGRPWCHTVGGPHCKFYLQSPTGLQLWAQAYYTSFPISAADKYNTAHSPIILLFFFIFVLENRGNRSEHRAQRVGSWWYPDIDRRGEYIWLEEQLPECLPGGQITVCVTHRPP